MEFKVSFIFSRLHNFTAALFLDENFSNFPFSFSRDFEVDGCEDNLLVEVDLNKYNLLCIIRCFHSAVCVFSFSWEVHAGKNAWVTLSAKKMIFAQNSRMQNHVCHGGSRSYFLFFPRSQGCVKILSHDLQ